MTTFARGADYNAVRVPGTFLESAPFRRRQDAPLTRIVEAIRSVLDPDAVELEFYFHPENQRYRRRFLRTQASGARPVRKMRARESGASALKASFRAPELIEGTLTLFRRVRRPWTGPEILRFEVLQPLLSQLLEYAARCEVTAIGRRRLQAAADQADAPILLLSAAGTVLYANGAAGFLIDGSAEGGVQVISEEGRETPLLPYLVRLGEGSPRARRRLTFTNGRSFEARLAPLADLDEPVTVVTLREMAGLTIEDVAPELQERGVSDREIEVLRAVLQGLRNAEIAAQLFITEWTVKDHLKHIFHKLGVSSRGGLIRALYAAPQPCGEGQTRQPGNGAKTQPVGPQRRADLKM
jgi:DNA-binding CsgD family transcriptional regulator/PAS domain-containing protein